MSLKKGDVERIFNKVDKSYREAKKPEYHKFEKYDGCCCNCKFKYDVGGIVICIHERVQEYKADEISACGYCTEHIFREEISKKIRKFNVRLKMEQTEEFYKRTGSKISNDHDICDVCKGTGFQELVPCANCDGKGEIPNIFHELFQNFQDDFN